jgi:hypothetical protein
MKNKQTRRKTKKTRRIKIKKKGKTFFFYVI